MAALGEMVRKEKRDWYFDYALFAETYQDVMKALTDVDVNYFPDEEWAKEDGGEAEYLEKLFHALAQRNKKSDTALGVLRSGLTKILKDRGRVCLDKIDREMRLEQVSVEDLERSAQAVLGGQKD